MLTLFYFLRKKIGEGKREGRCGRRLQVGVGVFKVVEVSESGKKGRGRAYFPISRLNVLNSHKKSTWLLVSRYGTEEDIEEEKLKEGGEKEGEKKKRLSEADVSSIPSLTLSVPYPY